MIFFNLKTGLSVRLSRTKRGCW